MPKPASSGLFGSNQKPRRASSAKECVVYSKHRCARTHRTFRAMASCIWRKGYYPPIGDGAYVALHRCRVGMFTITLCSTYEIAQQHNSYHCGGVCRMRHNVVKLRLDQQERWAA